MVSIGTVRSDKIFQGRGDISHTKWAWIKKNLFGKRWWECQNTKGYTPLKILSSARKIGLNPYIYIQGVLKPLAVVWYFLVRAKWSMSDGPDRTCLVRIGIWIIRERLHNFSEDTNISSIFGNKKVFSLIIKKHFIIYLSSNKNENNQENHQ